MRLIFILSSVLFYIQGTFSYERRSLIPATLRKKLCEADENLLLCKLQPQLERLDNPRKLTRWSICRDNPHLRICQRLHQNYPLNPSLFNSPFPRPPVPSIIRPEETTIPNFPSIEPLPIPDHDPIKGTITATDDKPETTTPSPSRVTRPLYEEVTVFEIKSNVPEKELETTVESNKTEKDSDNKPQDNFLR